MDEMKLKIGSGFMKNILAKLLTKLVRSKFDTDVQFDIHDLDISVDGEDSTVKLNVDVKMKTSEVKNLFTGLI